MKESKRALRAARSYSHNHDLQPKIDERSAKADSLLQSYLKGAGQTAA